MLPRDPRTNARANEPEQWPGMSVPDWDLVDEASWESFPASDPPSWQPSLHRAPDPERCIATSLHASPAMRLRDRLRRTVRRILIAARTRRTLVTKLFSAKT